MATLPRAVPGNVRLSFEDCALEVVLGHDGPLRGRPEPALLTAAYVCCGRQARLVTRSLFRFRLDRDPPCWAQIFDAPPKNESGRTSLDKSHVIILMVAIEEDGGRDIRSLYSALENTEELVVWPLDGEPIALAELSGTLAPGSPRQVGLTCSLGAPIDWFRSDDYVGSAAAWLPGSALRQRNDCVATIRSRDGLNEWTARAALWARRS